MSVRGTVRRTLEAVLPASMYNRLHAAVVARRARTWDAAPDPQIIQMLDRFVPAGSVTIDAGANLGQWSLQMSRRVGPTGLVHAFEPVPNFMDVLTRTLKQFGATHNVRLHRLALGDKEGSISFVTRNAKGESLSGEAHIGKPGERGDMEVPVKPLDSLLGSFDRITETRFVKVDVEGAELMLFRGAERFLKQVRPVVFSEVEDRHCAGFGHTRQAVIDYMASIGFAHEAVTHNDVLFTPR